MWHRVSAAAAVTVTVVLALAGNLATNTVTVDADWWTPFVWVVTCILAIFSIVAQVRHPELVDAGPSPRADLDSIADGLALAVHCQWQGEEEQRKVHDPIALPVRWRSVPGRVVDDWVNIRRAPVGSSGAPLSLSGQIDEIHDIYRRIPSGRLVILGRAGAGKTVLAARLTLALLASRSAGDPVPVIFSVGSWNPVTTSLRDWLAAQLIRDHPHLASCRGGTSLAAGLLSSDRILPVLDGFDEMSDRLQRAALERLNAVPGMGLVLTSRPEQYLAAVRKDDVLTAAAGIELEDLSPTELADYLPRTTRRCSTRNSGNVWHPVLARLKSRRDGVGAMLATVLATPLMVYLTRTIYSDSHDRDPLELLDAQRFRNPESLEEHLLSAFVPAVYREPSAAGRRWRPDRVQGWLTYLAGHLDRLGTGDIAWWQLRDTIPRRTRMIAVGLTMGTTTGSAVGLTFGWAIGPRAGIPGGLTVGFFGGAVSALAFGGPAIGPKPSYMRFQLRGRVRHVLHKVAFGLSLGIAVGPAGGLAMVIAVGPAVGITGGIVAGLAAGLGIGLTFGLEAPVDMTVAVDAAESLVVDRWNTVRHMLVSGLLSGAIGGVAFGIACEVASEKVNGVISGIAGGVAVGLAVAFAVGLMGAWGQWLVLVRLWLVLTNRLPARINEFLMDAYRRGVLRRSGAVYQFRHARLQNHLLGATSGRPSPGGAARPRAGARPPSGERRRGDVGSRRPV